MGAAGDWCASVSGKVGGIGRFGFGGLGLGSSLGPWLLPSQASGGVSVTVRTWHLVSKLLKTVYFFNPISLTPFLACKCRFV
jgi:hypothetical protein